MYSDSLKASVIALSQQQNLRYCSCLYCPRFESWSSVHHPSIDKKHDYFLRGITGFRNLAAPC